MYVIIQKDVISNVINKIKPNHSLYLGWLLHCQPYLQTFLGISFEIQTICKWAGYAFFFLGISYEVRSASCICYISQLDAGNNALERENHSC